MAIQKRLASLDEKLERLDVLRQIQTMTPTQVKEYLFSDEIKSFASKGDVCQYYRQYIDRIVNLEYLTLAAQ